MLALQLPAFTGTGAAAVPARGAVPASRAASAPRPAGSEASTMTPQVVPKPARLTAVAGESFTIAPDSDIVARDHRAEPAALALAELLRPATGYPLPITDDGPGISLGIGGPARLGTEGYLLDVTGGEARLLARTGEGLFRGVQTLRQLLPPAVESRTPQPGPWTLPGVHIDDKPRFGWRGVMLDVSRHFFSVDEVKRYIDLAALYKVNTFHLHLSDDQGWRIAIDGWPRLAAYGGSTEVGGGPGGHYTKADYTEIVEYATRHYMTVVPEIDMPGHTNAALASYAELNCDGKAPPLYTGIEVGFSSLCVPLDVTYRFVDDVVREIAELTPGPYIHIGGDEAHNTKPEEYVAFVDRVRDIVADHGKRMVGWKEIAEAAIPEGSVAQYWGLSKPSPEAAEQARTAVRKGAKLVMSPADRVYLDMKYDEKTPYGLNWAGYVEVEKSYSWDPASVVEGIGDADIRGVEAPLWTETLDSIPPAEFMAYPRIPGAAEVGWSPATGRSWAEYRTRLAAQGPRWERMGVNFYRSPQVPWPPASAEGGS
jgi:hexosaminidase